MTIRLSFPATLWAIAIVSVSLLQALPSAAGKPVKAALPTSGKVLKLTTGDLMCYVDLIDARGKKYNLGADFDICEQSQTFLHRQVKLTYKPIKVNDCQSSEPTSKIRSYLILIS
jgi:hypothetical protein